MYMKNWTRVTTSGIASPESRDLATAMTVAAPFEGKVRLAFAVLLSYVELLRVGEIVGATRRQFELFGGGSLLTFALPDSKGAQPKGMAEQVTICDSLVLKVGEIASSYTPQSPPKFPGWAHVWNVFRKVHAVLPPVWSALGISPNSTVATPRSSWDVGCAAKQQNCTTIQQRQRRQN